VRPSLSGVALPQLEHLLRLVASGDVTVPLTNTALQARGLAALWPGVSWLASLDRMGIEAVLQVAISERRTRPVPRLDLVWTGPEAKVSAARDTAVVVRELFNLAQRNVLVAGFRVDGGKTIFEPLQTAMRERGVDARLFLNFPARPGMSGGDAASHGVADFLSESWPPGEPVPAIYYDPRTVAPGSKINLHAKCVIVDARYVLIGSANFTHNAHARSIELGVLIEDTNIAVELTRQWDGLIDNGLVAAIQR